MAKEVFKTQYWKCIECGTFTDSGCCHRCNGHTQETTFEIKKNWDDIHTGNVVKWSNALYIVSGVHETMIDLIDFEYSNCSSHPSVNWPFNPSHRINSIEVISETIKDYIKESMNKLFER